MGLFALLPLLIRAILLPVIPIPKPGIQDEFSYLLAADTFASGRLTNASPPLWIHFETIHENLRPTYQSKYPPLQGLMLAFGQAFMGHPWFGVWLSIGVMCATLYWAFLAWLPPKWALLGGLLATLHLGILNYWTESYWGGAGAAIGGALVVGSVPRLRSAFSSSAAFLFALGVALLANSRPYEGLILSVVCMAALLPKVALGRLLRTSALVLIPAALWMLYYNHRVSGDPFVMPYQVNERQYSNSSLFIWSTKPQPALHYNHEAIRAEWEDWTLGFRKNALEHPLAAHWRDTNMIVKFYLGWPLALCALIMTWRILFCSELRLAALLLLVFIAGLELEVVLLPHYVAPGTALIWIVAIGAVRSLRHSSRVLAGAVLLGSLLVYAGSIKDPANRSLYDKRGFIAHRDAVLDQLSRAPGRQLVFVDYGPSHDINHEWVYNQADIDRSPIVWAREMGSAKDRELVDYYPDRNRWRLLDNGPRGVVLSAITTP